MDLTAYQNARKDACEDNMFHRARLAWERLDDEQHAMLRTGNVRGLEVGQAWGWSPAMQPVEYRYFGAEAPLILYTALKEHGILRDLHMSLEHRNTIDERAALDLAIAHADLEVAALLVTPTAPYVWSYVEAMRPHESWTDAQREVLALAQDWTRSGRAHVAATEAAASLL